MADVLAMTIDPEMNLYLVVGLAGQYGWDNLPRTITWQVTRIEIIEIDNKEIENEVTEDFSKTAPDDVVVPGTDIFTYRYLERTAASEADADTKLIDIKTWVTERFQDVLRKTATRAKEEMEIKILQNQIEQKRQEVREEWKDKELMIEL